MERKVWGGANLTKVIRAHDQVIIVPGVVAGNAHGVVDGDGLVLVAAGDPADVHHWLIFHQH